MATWIAHLRIAENLLERIPNLDAAQFAIGNLAPDSGIPDEKWEHFDPPKEVTHFLRNGTSESHIHDLLFYHQHLAHISPLDRERFSLRLGYFFHLLADGLWSRKIGPPFKKAFCRRIERPRFYLGGKARLVWSGFNPRARYPRFAVLARFLAGRTNCF